MKLNVTAIALGVLGACGQAPEVPEYIYEQQLNPEKFTQCMFDMLTYNTACRMQQDKFVFESCLSVHHRNCVEQATEMVKGGVK